MTLKYNLIILVVYRMPFIFCYLICSFGRQTTAISYLLCSNNTTGKRKVNHTLCRVFPKASALESI